jgi:hypothetical protein
VYVAQNLLVDENVPKVDEIMRRAAAVGYTGIVLADYKLNILDRMDPRYFRNVEQVKSTAKSLRLEIIPCVFPIGYSNGLLAHDPNLIEAMPVKDAPFLVKTGKADIAPARPPAPNFGGVEISQNSGGIINGGFETSRGDSATGWGYQDDPGKVSFIDRETKHSGSSSLRFGTPGAAPTAALNWRINQPIKLKPWRCYRMSFWIKTQDLDSPGSFNAPILISGSGKPALSHLSYGIKRTQDWTLHQTIFNSQDNSEALAYIGVWGPKSGAYWLDDVKLEETGLLNVVRRAGCPLVVKSVDGTTYEEGRDFQPVKDERLGNVPYAGEYELYHPPPSIVLTENSRIKDGQRLRVSFYHAAVVNEMQASCCLTEPKVYELLRDQMQRVEKLFHPTAVMMSHDEIRVANWCALCQAQNKTPGQLLAENARRCIQIVKSTSPQARIYTWNDMFDPFHNAHDNYYLVNGTWAGSWEGLTQDVGIVNWYFEPRKKNLPWFADRGHKQILAGYYDNNVDYTVQWLKDSAGIKGIEGVMYTTWRNDFSQLEKYAQTVWGGKR